MTGIFSCIPVYRKTSIQQSHKRLPISSNAEMGVRRVLHAPGAQIFREQLDPSEITLTKVVSPELSFNQSNTSFVHTVNINDRKSRMGVTNEIHF